MIGWLIGAAAGFLGSLGLGGGTLLMMWMAFFEDAAQGTLAGVNLMFFLGGGVGPAAVYAFRRLVDWGRLLRAVLCGSVGVLAGWWLSACLEGDWLSRAFAVLLILIGVRELLRPSPKTAEKPRRQTKK